MSILKSEISKRIIRRAKRYFVLIVLLPLLTAGFAYYFEANTPVTHTAQAEILLGNFEDDEMTNLGALPGMIKSPDFFEGHENRQELMEIANKVTYKQNPDSKSLGVSLTGTDKEEVEAKLEEFVSAIIEKSDSVYQEKVADIEESIDKVKQLNVENDGAVYKADLLFQFNEKLDALRNTVVSQPVTVTSAYNNPSKRAVFGFLVGLMLAVMLLVSPEILRNDPNNEDLK